MRPSKTFLWLLGSWMLLALPVAALRYLDQPQGAADYAKIWWLAGLALALLALLDGYRSAALKTIEATRQLPGTLAVGVFQPVVVGITNPLSRPLRATVTDQWPAEAELAGMPVSVILPANGSTKIHYQLQANRRGQLASGQVDMRIRSPIGLWDMRLLRGKSDSPRVYPNFAPIFNAEALSLDQQINRLGAHRMQQRGTGMDFHQLREFRQGDMLRQVDWKASSRLRKLISREYQLERDQDIVFLLDCGRRMRARDEGLSHFDHALNAMLLSAWIALRQGDAVGFQTFAGGKTQPDRWLTPNKGQATVNRILQHTYDLHSTTNSSDFLEAAEQIISRHRKRALIVLISNVREEDRDDLLAATRLLCSRHMVMVASLREQVLDHTAQQPVQNFEQAISYAGTRQYLDQRQLLMRELRNAGVMVVDASPDTLHIDMVTQYLQLKSSGRF